MAATPQAVPPGRHEAGFRTQMRCLSLRLLRNAYRHPFLISVNLLANLGMAMLVATVFYDAGNAVVPPVAPDESQQPRSQLT